MTPALKIYVGHDSREDIAWQVCQHSILRNASSPVEIHPLKQPALRELGLYTRDMDNASTEFSLTRFLTPYLAAHDGWSIFMDCDFLVSDDIWKVLDGLDPSKALFCVQHDYTPSHTTKMDGKQQTVYPRKNWSSFMLFNGAHPSVKALTPKVVNQQSPAFLHRFEWVDDSDLGRLDLTWNFLEGEYDKPAEIPNCVHYTNGGPWFDNWQNVDFADEWRAERNLYEAKRLAV
ncbi:glycosyltransferase [Qingshengfaniella alkalisoli]|uniref:Glycosyltransferase n=1 Tax=Qingshengfaniella alkalisoli TaxID=2599296 RepID=A0A5B8ICA3_9RHOB|nr:glycosyltransferase [Qingshengfaniella alkalisoli]QDY71186.1 glycosyltransferase [Qingshengfaniella alkalisoli]